MAYIGLNDFISRAKDKLSGPNDDLNSQIGSFNPQVAGDGSGLPIEDLLPAAVLFGVIKRDDEGFVVFTQRPQTMKAHPGQIALPGGKLELGETPAQAALREAQEEISAPADRVELIAQLPAYRTGSGFSVSMLVGVYPETFIPQANPQEVDDIFETPLSFLMDSDNHESHERRWGGGMRKFFAMPYEGRFIWGVTAGMIKILYDQLYAVNESGM